MYLELGRVQLAKRVFDRMVKRDIVSWNSMIVGCFKVGEVELSGAFFDEMPETQRDVVSWNMIIDGYAKCGKCELVREFFGKMGYRHVVSWMTMISGEMLGSGTELDVAAIVSVVSTIADLGFVEEGKWVHAYIHARKISLRSGVLASAFIDMYSKCGHIENANNVFESVSVRCNAGDWNSMISGLATHGLAYNAFEMFRKMERMDIEPNEITFLEYLVRLVRVAMEALKDSSCYPLLSNIYAKASRWSDVARIRAIMRDRGIKKRKKKRRVYLSLHSEKLTLAFGLINTSKGEPIHIVKNLRVCCDCHLFIKLASRVYNRRIVVRDQNRFHHFESGSCSCKEYW
ncbi:hypothetical protein GIB67_011162 [Kingdonia uniflora]|uniref:DYW domain-containing protein n=1 Tax=Kingdonia uniflora TaxID=39325 RepID=A0A7J7PAJ1_9MAGN|nr:hypothetical protein GIB67_011162 [Kingdonia uniflora]